MKKILEKFLGPQVAIIDNNEAEIKSIEFELNEMHIGNKFYEVDFLEPIYPLQPLSTVELVFLDLYYQSGFQDFDPYVCVQWLTKIVPEGKKYVLIVWSNDTHQTDRLLDTIKELNAPYPFLVETKEKNIYRTGENDYDIKKLLAELNIDFQGKMDIDIREYQGQIIEVEKKSVLIKCKISADPDKFEVRRFDLIPFENYIDLKIGNFILITVINKPGSKAFEFSPIYSDLSEAFIKSDDFADIDTSLFEDENDGDENHL